MWNREYIDGEINIEMLKKHLRITSNAFDDDLKLKLRAAYLSAENFLGITLLPSIYTLVDSFSEWVEIDFYPYEIISVKVDKSDADYILSGNLLILKNYGEKIEVKIKAGINNIPDDIKSAILLIASALFNNPVDSVEQLPKVSTNLLRPYRRWIK